MSEVCAPTATSNPAPEAAGSALAMDDPKVEMDIDPGSFIDSSEAFSTCLGATSSPSADPM